MADDLNALLAANRSSSVLQGIANPPQINPLAAITAGNQAAQQEFETRAWQAKEAAGRAFQNAINPDTGQMDQAQLLRNLRDPRAALAAQNSAQAGQTLDTGTYDLHNKRLTSMMSGMGQLIADNPNGVPAEAASAVVDHRLALGLITPEEAQAMKGRLTSDPVKNTQIILQGMTSNLSAQGALEAVRPGTGTADTGQVFTGTTRTPVVSSTGQQGAVSPVGPAIPKSMPPGQGGMVDAVIQTEKGPVTIQVPYQQAFPGQVTPAAPGSGGGGGGGAPSVTPPPPHKGNTQRSSFPPPPPVIQTSPTPSSPTPAPIVPGEATPAPAAAPTPNTPAPTASSPVIQTPAGPAVVKTAPVGTEQDITAYKAAQAAMPEQQKSLTAGLAALEALKLARTGPGTTTSNAVKSFMIAQGIGGADLVDQGPEQYQIARKNLLRFAQANGGKVGTDLGLSTQLESNANVDTLLNSVNDHIMKQDIATLRQRIAQTQTAPGAGGTGKTEFGEGMGAHVQNFTPKTDRMAFAWDLLTPAERQEHLDQISKQEGGKEKWERSMKIARDTGAWSLPRAAPPAPPPVVRPPPPNPLIPPAGPGGG